MISLSRLKELLHYDPETGHITWRVNRCRMAKAGQRAGTLNKYGYIMLHVEGRMYSAHRLAVFYMTGSWPPEQVDHINGVRNDNRYVNLRCAPMKLNLLNRKRYATSTSGHKGVTWHPKLGKWRVRVQKFGKRYSLGCYNTLDEARAAYEAGAKAVYGEFHRDGHYMPIEERKRA